MRELLTDVLVKRVISSISGAIDNTAQVGQIIDRQGFDSLLYVLNIGTVADVDVTFTVLLEEGDQANLSDAAAVADKDMVGQDPSSATAPEAQAGFQFDDDNEVRKLGYIGNKRYTRLTITPANNTGAWPIGAVAILGHPDRRPVVQAAA